MDSFELNKVAGAVLGTLLFAFGTGFLAELIYHPKPAGKAGYALPAPGGEKDGGGGGEAAAAPKPDSIAARLASADAEKGKGGTKPCQACHSFEKGGPNKIGPDLWEVVGRKKGSHEGFDYSAGMKEKGGEWTYEDLDHFLENPKGFVKGTKMAFAGIGDPKDRANVILYLHSLADSPKPLPEAEKKSEGKAEGEKKPEGGKADGKKDDGKKAEGVKPEEKQAEKPAEAKKPDEGKTDDAAKKDDAKTGEAAKPAQGETADTDRPGGSGKAESQTTTKENPPEAKPEGGASDAASKGSEGPAATETPAKPDPAAEKKADEQKAGDGEQKAQ